MLFRSVGNRLLPRNRLWAALLGRKRCPAGRWFLGRILDRRHKSRDFFFLFRTEKRDVRNRFAHSGRRCLWFFNRNRRGLRLTERKRLILFIRRQRNVGNHFRPGGSGSRNSFFCRGRRLFRFRHRLEFILGKEDFIRVHVIHPDEISRVEAGRLWLLPNFPGRLRLSGKPGIRLADGQSNADDNQNKDNNTRAEAAEQGNHPSDQKAGDHASAFEQLPFGKEAVDLVGEVGKIHAARSFKESDIHKSGKQNRDQQNAYNTHRPLAGGLEKHQSHPEEADGTGVIAVPQNAAHKLADGKDDSTFLDKIADRRKARQEQKHKAQCDAARVVLGAGVLPIGLPSGSGCGFFIIFCSFLGLSHQRNLFQIYKCN